MALSEIDTKWIDGVISRLFNLYNKPGMITNVMSFDEVLRVLAFASRVLMMDGCLVEVDVPIKVVGDIHGQYQDMHKLFDLIGRVPETKMIFLGDYVDRGNQSLETIVYLFAMKIRHRDRIFLLRGNHETPAVNRIYGFYAECSSRYGPGLWWEFISVFNRIPMAGLIAKRILCMHGGLSPELTSLDLIRRVKRPCEPVDRGLLVDLVWSDPTSQGDGWFYSPRGLSYAFGKGIVSAALKMLKIDLVIRAHQVVQDGYELMVGRQLITIFSAPNYAGQFNNAAAVVCIDADLQITFQQLRVPPPNSRCIRPCPPCACEPGKALELPPKLPPKEGENKDKAGEKDAPKTASEKSMESTKTDEEKKTDDKKTDEKKADDKPEEKKADPPAAEEKKDEPSANAESSEHKDAEVKAA